MFKLLRKTAPVIPPTARSNAAGSTSVNNTAQPRALNLAQGPERDKGVECLPLEAWHESAKQRAPNRLGAQPTDIAKRIAGFLGDDALHALGQTSQQFKAIAQNNARFAAKAQLHQIDQQAKAMTDESNRLKTALPFLWDVESNITSHNIRGYKGLERLHHTATATAAETHKRINELSASLEDLKLKRYDVLRDMKATEANAQGGPETKARPMTGTSASSSSSSSSHTMPMRPDQMQARQTMVQGDDQPLTPPVQPPSA